MKISFVRVYFFLTVLRYAELAFIEIKKELLENSVFFKEPMLLKHCLPKQSEIRKADQLHTKYKYFPKISSSDLWILHILHEN